MRLSYQTALFVLGIFTLVVTLVHGAWYWYLPHYAVTESIDPSLQRTLLLMNEAITLFLLVTGLAAIVASKSKALSTGVLRVVTLFYLGFWIGRLLLEFWLPLGIPLLFIDKPQLPAKVLIACPVVLLILTLISNSRASQ